MNHTKETVLQSSITEQRAEVEQELRLAKEYWLKTIQPHVKGRILRGVEFFVAQQAHWSLRKAMTKAGDWNQLCDVTRDASRMPVSVDVDLSANDFRMPELPKLLFANNVKPEILAAIAAPLVKDAAKLTPAEAIHNAHELLMAAERHIGTLPKKEEGTGNIVAAIEEALSTVTFTEILQSNEKDSEQLPLLPPVQQERNQGKLSRTALKIAVKRFLEQKKKNYPQITEAQWDRQAEQTTRLAQAGQLVLIGGEERMTYQEWVSQPDEAIRDCLQNDWILLQDLCTLRWERFKNFWQKQQSRTQKRKPSESKRPKKSKSKTNLPQSAASSPTTAGKRKQ